MITCSIVLYNNDRKILLETIKSFLNTDLDVFLYLVDNSKNDNLRDIYIDKRISYIHNPSNPGFGASHNIAIEKSFNLNANYHLVLNPDIYFNSGTIDKIFSFMESRPDIGHLMPKILSTDGNLQFLCKTNPTFFDLFARGFLPIIIKKFLKKRLDRYLYKSYDFDKPIYNIPYLSGCFMFFRSSTLREVGYFDEKIFMYLEDADITRRFLKISKTVYYPDVFVYHHYSGLTHKHLKYKLITIQSAILYFNKWGWLKNLI
jgi:GT2 family glycosyltransferase